MTLGGVLFFAAPWVLCGLIVLPVVWYLLRVTPPRPKRVVFPPVKLLAGLNGEEQTPAGTPWWLMALRLTAAAALIVALAGPQIGRALDLRGTSQRPVLMFVDNGWTAAHGWNARAELLHQAVRLSERQGRPVGLIATADRFDPSLMDAGAALRAVDALRPRPWAVGREKALKAVAAMKLSGAEVLWLSDGVDDGLAGKTATILKKYGTLNLYRDAPGDTPVAITAVDNRTDGFVVTLLRAGVEGRRLGRVAAHGPQGEVLGDADFRFDEGKNRLEIRLDMPAQMRAKTEQIVVEGERSAGGVYLFDRGSPRRAVGLVTAAGSGTEPLLSGEYYLEKALRPYADLVSGSVSTVLERKVSVLVLADIGKLAGTERDQVAKFVEDGGLLIRFASDRLTDGTDDLVPVRLRSGGRSMGGTLSWAAPQQLTAFSANSPFAGLSIPDDVSVSRQILAEPSIELTGHTWARLKDGTPMVTAARHGKGWIVMFHVTAGPGWSSLPLSGLYVGMLRRLMPLANGAVPTDATEAALLSPASVLDGFGRLHRAGGEVRPIPATTFEKTEAGPQTPPGLYGSTGNERALNAARPQTALLSMGPVGGHRLIYGAKAEIDLTAPLFLLALALTFADLVLSFFMRGLVADMKNVLRRLVPALAMLLILPHDGARASDATAMKAALDTRLAYVVTGARDTDGISRAGLVGLGRALSRRTSYAPPEPMGVDLETDDLSFFPLIYWPMEPRQRDLSPKALAKVAEYMRNGGTFLIDTRDLSLGAERGPNAPGQRTLRRLLGRVDLPALEPVPANHVLNRTFYLISDYPGRWAGDRLWIETAADAGHGDGVSPVLVGGGDWAAAWAVDANGRPIADVSPGGDRQREMAIRFGINVAMYALTGNYKTDQIHVRTLLKRMGK